MVFEYSPATEPRSVTALRQSYGLFVDGAHLSGHGDQYRLTEPGTGEPLTEIAPANSDDVDLAVAAAHRASEGSWSSPEGRERVRHLFRLTRLVEDHGRELAVLSTLETGTPVRTSRDLEVASAVSHLFHHAGWADKLAHAVPGNPAPRAHGVVAQVIEDARPLLTLARMAAPALAAGNTVILKPARSTPLSALRFAELCHEAGLPPGVVTVLTGSGQTSELLVAHPQVDHVTFCGNPDGARLIARTAAGHGTSTTVEVAGPQLAVVLDDAPVDEAVEGVLNTILLQARAVPARLLVQESLAEEFAVRLLDRVATLRTGDVLDQNTDVAKGSDELQLPAVETFRTPAEALQRTGRAAGAQVSVWTEKGSTATWLARRLPASVVWLNTTARVEPTAPVGVSRLTEYLR